MMKKNNFIQFLDEKIFIYNSKLKNNLFSQKLKTDYIYLTGNKDLELNEINSNFDYQTLILDGSNSDYLISNVKHLNENNPGSYIILKSNKSFISVSN